MPIKENHDNKSRCTSYRGNRATKCSAQQTTHNSYLSYSIAGVRRHTNNLMHPRISAVGAHDHLLSTQKGQVGARTGSSPKLRRRTRGQVLASDFLTIRKSDEQRISIAWAGHCGGGTVRPGTRGHSDRDDDSRQGVHKLTFNKRGDKRGSFSSLDGSHARPFYRSSHR